jgi:hypothetical protein
LRCVQILLANLNPIRSGRGNLDNFLDQDSALPAYRSRKLLAIRDVAENRRLTNWREAGHGQAQDAD